MAPKNFSQLKGLQEKYRDAGLQILLFPCNGFANQEPSSGKQLCPLYAGEGLAGMRTFSKLVVNGPQTHDVYKFLRSATLSNQNFQNANQNRIQWNFVKFIVDKQGKVRKRYTPKTELGDLDQIISSLLDEKCNVIGATGADDIESAPNKNSKSSLHNGPRSSSIFRRICAYLRFGF